MNGFIIGFIVALGLAALFDHYILHVKRKQLIADFDAWKVNASQWFALELAKAKAEVKGLIPGGNAAPSANAAQAGNSTVKSRSLAPRRRVK